MVSELSIENYKSIKKLKIPCKRVNIFIGEPNTGKSNILEALSFFSPDSVQNDIFNEVIRFQTLGDLFYDNDINTPIVISTNEKVFRLSFARNDNGTLLNQFLGSFYDPAKPPKKDGTAFNGGAKFYFNHKGGINQQNGGNFDTKIRTYIFKRLKTFNLSYVNYLNTPFGGNIPGLLLSNNKLKKIVSDL